MPDSTPLQVPVPVRPTPELLDSAFYEIVDTDKRDYVQIPYGAYHPKVREFPAHRLIKEEQISHNRARRWWSDGYELQNWYNYSLRYNAESTSHPVFIRRYLIRRDQYATVTTGASPLTGIWQVVVTAGGSGYSPATTVAITGATGSGATAEPVIADGAIVWVRLTAEGSSYTAPLVVAFTDATGVGATATATIQPVSAVVVHQEVDDLPEGDQRRSLYVLVTRVYKVLPGPTLSTVRVNERGDTETIVNQEVATGTTPTADGLLVSQSQVVPQDTAVANKTTGTVDTYTPLVAYELYYKDGSLKKITRTVVAPGTLPTGGDTVLTDSVDQRTKTKAERTVVEVVDSAGGALLVIPPKVRTKLYPRERALATITFRIVPDGTAEPVEGTAFGTGKILSAGAWSTQTAYVVDVESREIEGSKNILQIIEACPIPPTRYEYPEVGFRYPAIFDFITSWSPSDTTPPPPNLGVNYSYLAHRSQTTCARIEYSYRLGAPTNTPTIFQVKTPAAASRIFQIPENTIHPAYDVYFDATLVERVPASTPGTYSPSNILLISFDAIPWKGTIYEQREVKVSESTDPTDFPP